MRPTNPSHSAQPNNPTQTPSAKKPPTQSRLDKKVTDTQSTTSSPLLIGKDIFQTLYIHINPINQPIQSKLITPTPTNPYNSAKQPAHATNQPIKAPKQCTPAYSTNSASPVNQPVQQRKATRQCNNPISKNDKTIQLTKQARTLKRI